MKAEEGRTRIGMFQVEYAGYSDIGRQRLINEDDFLLLPEKGMFCLADGLGALEKGQAASAIALKSIRDLLSATAHSHFFVFRKNNCSLQQVISHANSCVYEKRRKLKLNTATTMVIVQIGEHSAQIAHVGDSRVYRWNGNALLRCTEDHSLVEELYRKVGLSEEQLNNHPQRHVITRAVGAEAEVKVHVQSIEVQGGDILLLCSDGLTTMLGDRELERILRRYQGNIIRAGRSLVTAANDAGGQDNITVVLLAIAETEYH